MRTTLRLLAVMLTCLLCAAQDAVSASIAGVVMAGPGEPIAGAKVELRSQARKFAGETDRAGHYQLDGLSAGEYTFQVRSAGFKTYEIKSVQIAAGELLRMPETEIDVAAMCGETSRESLRMLPGAPPFRNSEEFGVPLVAPLFSDNRDSGVWRRPCVRIDTNKLDWKS